jgi:hypothetical protein
MGAYSLTGSQLLQSKNPFTVVPAAMTSFVGEMQFMTLNVQGVDADSGVASCINLKDFLKS